MVCGASPQSLLLLLTADHHKFIVKDLTDLRALTSMKFLVYAVSLTMEIRVGRKRTIVIPKAVAEALGIDEGSRLVLEVRDGCILLKPIPDAITLSIRGEKIAKVSIEDLEATSLEEQERYLEEA